MFISLWGLIRAELGTPEYVYSCLGDKGGTDSAPMGAGVLYTARGLMRIHA